MTEFTCKFKIRAEKLSDDYSGTINQMILQCANEHNHSGDHLIVVPR